MKVLLTGAPGFVGAALARLLIQEGYQVYALVRPESDLWRIQDLGDSINILHGDLLSPGQVATCVERVQPELCFHLAWCAEPGVYLSSPLNIQYVNASLNLASRLAEAGCRRLVAAGTVAEYDADFGYLSESTPTRPVSLYAASKVALFTLLNQLAKQIELTLAWARIFYIYGPYENERRFIPDIINTLLRNEPTRTTPGEQVRDYLHVADVARALSAVGRSDISGAVNIGTGLPVTNRDIVLKIGSLLDRPDLVKFGDLPYRSGDPMFVCADNRRLVEATGWRPRYDLERGLENTVAWWRERLDAS